ncbi:MAG: ankyrin repeat domain-containing protein [Pseudomonadales bacterium]|jgi:ankyrin repeat protein|nr:ankyrin repeat domain-containing protein [Pseudomonadales bacterium]
MKTHWSCLIAAVASLYSFGVAAQLPQLLEAGQGAAAREAVAQGSDVNERSVDGTSALHWAVYQGDLALVNLLIEHGADVNARNDYGATPLSTAAVNANAGIIQALLTAGADANARNADNETALMVVARAGGVEAARLLLTHGAEVNAAENLAGQTALMWAAAHRHPDMLRLLLEAGAEVDATSAFRDWPRIVTAEPRIKTLYSGGFTALLYAAREGCRDCAEVLLAAGADIDKTDPWGITPLILALLNMNFDTAALLIEAGADVNRWDWWGRTPLYAAIDLNTLPQGSRPDLPSTDSLSGLDLARMLLERGADPNIRLKNEPPARGGTGDRGQLEGSTDAYVLSAGATALHRAAKSSDDAAIKLLVEYGANVNLPNQIWGITPILAAAGVGHILGNFAEYPSRGAFKTDAQAVATVKLLQSFGADILARDKRGFTAAHGAAEMGWSETLRYLHAQGVPLDAVALTPDRLLPGGSYTYKVPVKFPEPGPQDNWTPLESARHEGHTEGAELIQTLLLPP